jgi:hypothetical protein
VDDAGVVSAALSVERTPWAEWAVAVAISVLVNGVLFFAFAVMLALEVVNQPAEPEEEIETVAVIRPGRIKTVKPVQGEKVAQKRPFARTSPDQPASAGERSRFIGERATAASSEAVPVAGAPNLPSQTGEDSRFDKEVETTTSDYQDGDLSHDRSAQPAPAPAVPAPPVDPVLKTEADPGKVPTESRAEAAEPSPTEPLKSDQPDALDTESTAPPKQRLAQGPLAVDRPMPPEKEKTDEQIKEAARKPAEAGSSARPPEPKTSTDPAVKPGFRGYQRKTRLHGSISRRGKSSLDVDKTALGQYQAALSRAVEREWQRNCVRYRDHITPGFLTVRVLVNPDGGIRSIEFLEAVEAGEIQKGFTLKSIRDADIPKMPKDVKKELDGEPLELIYNFYF